MNKIKKSKTLFYNYLKIQILQRNTLYKIIIRIRTILNLFFVVRGKNNNIIQKGLLFKMSKDIVGSNNVVIFEKGSKIFNSKIYIHGDNNRILVEKGCHIGKGSSLWIDGDNNSIIIRKNSTFTYGVHLCAQEKNVKIEIGEDCMFANQIIVRNSDSHPIYDNLTGKRLNPAKSVIISNHVWVAAKATIMKGVNIGSGSIVGYLAVVTKNIPTNVLVVGSPAKIVKENISWTRERLF